MKKVGAVCDMAWSRCHNIKQYYYYIKNLYGGIKLVYNYKDLDGLDILFVGDDHHPEHADIIAIPGFIEKCNADKIEVVVCTAERIFDSFFDLNIGKFKRVKRFNNLHLWTADVDDCELLGTKLYRSVFSKHYKNFAKVDVNNKIDEIVFIGSADPKMYGGCYKKRADEIIALRKLMPVTIIPSTIKSWKKYIDTLAKYRFVFYPRPNGNFLSFRFYETLLVKSIPVCHVQENTLKHYNIEAKYDDCIFYKDVAEIPEKIKNCTLQHSHNELWAEDWMREELKKEGLL